MLHDGASQHRPRVVIVGGGFGGFEAAHKLKRADVDVTIIDRHNHHLFQPLIYQVAAGALSSGQVAAPIRGMVKRQPNASVLMASATDVDVDHRQVVLDRGDRIDYDRLILACGGETSYFGHDDWQTLTWPLKTLDDAIRLRGRIFAAFEEAERADDPAERERWLTFVVVGGGPTGVEIAGQLAILGRHAMRRDFRRVDPRQARVILLDAGDRVVPAFSERTSAKAAKELGALGVAVRERAMATDVDEGGLTIKIGGSLEQIPAGTVIWAAGVRTAGVAAALARSAHVETDRAGRIKVNQDLTLPGHPEIAVIGDAACVAGPDGKPLPGLATVAIQEARHVASQIAQGHITGSKPFRYFDKGALAVVGRGRAVCEVRGRRLSGVPAFLMYLGIHLYYLGGVGGRRLTVFSTWVQTGFGVRQNRVMERELTTPRQPTPGDNTEGAHKPTRAFT